MHAGCAWRRAGGATGFGARRSEGTDEENHAPALLFGQAFFEGRHGLVAFGDFVEELAVGFGAEALAVRKIGWSGVVRGGVGAVAFAGLSMAAFAIITVKVSRIGKSSW